MKPGFRYFCIYELRSDIRYGYAPEIQSIRRNIYISGPYDSAAFDPGIAKNGSKVFVCGNIHHR